MQPQPQFTNHRLVVGLAIALAGLTLLLFAPVFHNDFLNWDDQSYVTQNDYVLGGVTAKGAVWAFTESHSANWHPLTWLSHMLDVSVFGLKPGWHHLTNACLHAINTALLFLVLCTMTGAVWRSALVAALFALHPLRVESVAWLAERKDVLSTCFGLLCLLAYGVYSNARRERRTAKRAYMLAFLFLALGLMSKPMLVTWPFVMLLLDFWPLERIQLSTLKRLLWEKVPFLALVLASSVVTVIAQQRGGAVASFEHLPLDLRLQNAVVAYAQYLAKFFWPANLSPVYPHPASVPIWQWIGATIFIAGLTLLAWRLRQRFPFMLTGWLWFLGTLVPVIGIVQVGSQAFADRYTYVPMIGVAIALVWLGNEIAVSRQLPKALIASGVAVILTLLGWRTTVQLAQWKNTETLFRYTLMLSPNNVQALFGLGSYLVEHGQEAAGKRMLERTIQLQPTYAEAIGTLASTLDGEGRYGEAVQLYQDALKVQPNHAGVLNNFAWLLASCPDAAMRDGSQAVQYAMRACELTGFRRPLFIGTLAAAQAEAGDFQDAIATAERAVTLATSLGLMETAARNRRLIEFYQHGKAAHGAPPSTNRPPK